MANSVDPDQTAVCSGSTLFAFILNATVKLGNYLQQTTSTDDIFRCIFSLALSGLVLLEVYLIHFNKTGPLNLITSMRKSSLVL